jgi:hypothetical protein
VSLALASQDLHGYGIIQEVTRLSEGKYGLGPGTLYDNLKKLMNCGWAEDYQDDQLPASKETHVQAHSSWPNRAAVRLKQDEKNTSHSWWAVT